MGTVYKDVSVEIDVSAYDLEQDELEEIGKKHMCEVILDRVHHKGEDLTAVVTEIMHKAGHY